MFALTRTRLRWIAALARLRSLLPLLSALGAAVAVKIALLAADAVPFNSDEAIVALMARHILQGERPIFFYGQAYMGSLDAWLVAAAFGLIGEGVLAVRVVQAILYLGYLFTLWLLARRWLGERIANIAVLLAAVPTVLVSTYTTASLGGYGETLFLGNLILLIGSHVVLGDGSGSWRAWLALGLVGGLAFWTLGLAALYLLPVGLVGLWRIRSMRPPLVAWSLCGFIVASSPWWIHDLMSSGAAHTALTWATLASTTPAERLTGFLLLGVPALLGLRWPWSPDFIPLPIAILQLTFYANAASLVVWLLRKRGLKSVRQSWWLLGLQVLGFAVLFVGTHFGIDATGRYYLSLYLPLVLGMAFFVDWIWRRRVWAGAMLLVVFTAVNATETWRAVLSDERLTTQFDPITRFDNRHDAALIDFLNRQGETRGYSNYWVSYRLAFLTREELIYTPVLPYKADMSYSVLDNRYPAYDGLVAASTRVAYITTKHPSLDDRIREAFDGLNVSFAEAQIGDFHVFYGLSRPVRPAEIGLGGIVS